MEYHGKITALIAVNEPLVQKLLKSYLEEFPQVKVAAAVPDGNKLLEIIKKVRVDAVFIDTEMPGMDGMSAAAKIKKYNPDILIVFVTSHTKYAAESYRLGAVDYLVQPVTRDSIARAVKKIEQLRQVNMKYSSPNEGRILVKNNHEMYFINLVEIIFIEKELRKTVIHSLNGKYITTEPLRDLEKKLDSKFFRCHKSFIVNIDMIERIVPIADRLYEVSFYNYPYRVTMRRKKLNELCSIIEKH